MSRGRLDRAVSRIPEVAMGILGWNNFIFILFFVVGALEK
jgi:hypothetical protein